MKKVYSTGKAHSQTISPNVSKTGSIIHANKQKPGRPKGSNKNDKTQHLLVLSNIKGNLTLLNERAKQTHCRAIVHVGDFGFFEGDGKGLSLLDEYICGSKQLNVPVYVVVGWNESVKVVEKFVNGLYHIPNLYLIRNQHSFVISTGECRVRLFGLDGSLGYSNLFDVGDGDAQVACGDAAGGCWSTLMQMGCLIESADTLKEMEEIRIFVCANSLPAQEPLAQLIALRIRADIFVTATGTNQSLQYPISALHYSADSLAESLAGCQQELLSLWEQIYFSNNEQFTEWLKQKCQKAISMFKSKEFINFVGLGMVVLGVGDGAIEGCKIYLESAQNISISFRNNFDFTRTAPLLAGTQQAHVDAKKKEQAKVIVKGESNGKAKEALALPIPDVRYEEAKGAVAKEATLPKPQDTENLAINQSKLNAASKNTSSPTTNNLNESRQSSITAAAVREESGHCDPERVLVIFNLPYEITGTQLDKQLLHSYEIEKILFTTPSHNVARVTFVSREEADRAQRETHCAIVGGREITVRHVASNKNSSGECISRSHTNTSNNDDRLWNSKDSFAVPSSTPSNWRNDGKTKPSTTPNTDTASKVAADEIKRVKNISLDSTGKSVKATVAPKNFENPTGSGEPETNQSKAAVRKTVEREPIPQESWQIKQSEIRETAAESSKTHKSKPSNSSSSKLDPSASSFELPLTAARKSSSATSKAISAGKSWETGKGDLGSSGVEAASLGISDRIDDLEWS